MGIITHTIEVVDVDLNNYIPEYYNCPDCGEQVEKHIIREGARYHVNHWDTQGARCSEKDCIVNHKCKGKTLEGELANKN